MKPPSSNGYSRPVTEACEQVLVTLLSGLGPWKESVVLVGGLTPRYLVTRKPPEVREHAGTGDVDLVVDFGVLADTKAYSTLQENLEGLGFERTVKNGSKQNWRWSIRTPNDIEIIIEFLSDNPEVKGGALKELPTKGRLSAVNIPHASIVSDLNDQIEVTADSLKTGARTTEVVAHANIVSFVCLKAFAFEHRREPKDAHDLVYCLENFDGEPPAVDQFKVALEGQHGQVIDKALKVLVTRFTDPVPEEAYMRDGPTAVGVFEVSEQDGDEDVREQRILVQRNAQQTVGTFLKALGYAP